MRRREVIALFGLAAAWPIAAGAHQSRLPRRIGILNPESASRVPGHLQQLANMVIE